MIKTIIIICDQSPIGSNSTSESIRMGAGLMAIGDLDGVKIIFMGDAVYFLNKNLNPAAVHMDEFSSLFRMMKLSDIEIYVLDTALKEAGLENSDLLEYENLRVVNLKEISRLILLADVTFRY